MDKLFEIESNQDFELGLHHIIHNLSYSSRKLENTPIALDNNELKAAENDVRQLIFNSNFDMKKVSETMAGKNWDKERIKWFVNLLDNEKANLLYASLNHHISGYGETMTQSDWLLKLVIGTSELNTLKYPFMQLIMSAVDSHGIQSQKLYELNKDMILRFIEALEKVVDVDY